MSLWEAFAREDYQMTAALAQAGRGWSRAKMKEREAMAYLYLAIQNAHRDGMPETEIAKVAGVDRMTVRRALGKR